MATKTKVLIIGGDDRQKYLNLYLLNRNIESEHIYLSDDLENIEELVAKANFIILPLPVSKNSTTVYCCNNAFKLRLSTLENLITEGKTVLGGMMNSDLKASLNDKKASYYDYYQNEGLVIQNSYLTALGAIKLLLDNTNEELHNKNFLITGFGSLAKATAQYIKALGGNVCIAARNKNKLIEAKRLSYDAISIFEMIDKVENFDYIMNTVPSIIFSKYDINSMKEDAIYMELASRPFGADKEWFASLKKKYISAPSLPGRLFPKSSARAILTAINDYI